MKVEEIDNEAIMRIITKDETYNMGQGECRRRNISFGTMKQEKCVYTRLRLKQGNKRQ